MLERLLTPKECREIAALYGDDSRFRSRIVMARHGFGQGEYKYFSYPLPAIDRAICGPRCIRASRRSPMRGTSAWESRRAIRRSTATFSRCATAAVRRGRRRCCCSYEAGDYNCLHQDLYGELAFPLQATILLSEPGKDFTGGEFVMTEQRPRMQSRAEVIPLAQGDAVVFAVHHRPVKGTRGTYRVNMRHGVSRLRSGHRMTLGVIFHDAK